MTMNQAHIMAEDRMGGMGGVVRTVLVRHPDAAQLIYSGVIDHTSALLFCTPPRG